MSKPLKYIAIGTALFFAPEFAPELVGLTGAFGTAISMLGMNMILGGVAYALSAQPTTKSYSPVRINTVGGTEILQIVFGEITIGGAVACKALRGTDNRYLYLAVVHSVALDCGNEGATAYYIGEKVVGTLDGSGNCTSGDFSGLLQIVHHDGNNGQAADTVLTTALGGTDWPSSRYLRGNQYTVAVCYHSADPVVHQRAFPMGEPVLRATDRGWKCYDPRLDTTHGFGTGSHDYTDPNTWAWTQNPALHAATYRIAPKKHGGWGRDPATQINWAAVAAAANVSDESVTVPSGTQARYTFDGVISTGEALEDNEKKLLSAMAGWSTEVGGVWAPYAGAYVAPTTTIDETWLAGEVDEAPFVPRDQVYNRVDATYFDAAMDYKTIQAWPYTNSAYETDDGSQLPRTMTHFGCTDRYRAQRLSFIAGRDSRNQRIVKLEFGPIGYSLEPGEFYALNLNLGGGNLITGNFLLVGWGNTETGVLCEFKEYASTTFDSDISDYTTITPVATADPAYLTPSVPTGLVATATADGIAVGITDAINPWNAVVVWERSTVGGGSGFSEVTRGVSLRSYRDPLVAGETRYYRAYLCNPLNQTIVSGYSSEVSATAKTVADGADVTASNPQPPSWLTGGRNRANIINNPGFEAGGSTDWQMSAGATIVAAGTGGIPAGMPGDYLLRIATTTQQRNCYGIKSTSGTPPVNIPRVQEGEVYYMSCWVAAEAGTVAGNCGFGVTCYKEDRTSTNVNVLNSAVSGLGTATQYTGTVTIPAGYTRAAPRFFINGNASPAGAIYFSQPMFSVAKPGADITGENTSADTAMVNAVAAATVQSNAQTGANLTVAGSGTTLGDVRNALQVFASNLGARFNTQPLTASDAGSTATISIAACNAQIGSRNPSYSAGSVTGLSFSTYYEVYADDPTLAGGAVTYHATTNKQTPSADNGRVWFGYITTPADGLGTTGGTGGGGAPCVATSSYLGGVDGPIACVDLLEGDVVIVEGGTHPCEKIFGVVEAECVTLETSSGITLTVSARTPVDLADGRSMLARDLIGEAVSVVDEHGERWERIAAVTDAGMRAVRRISFGGRSFAAGDQPGRYIKTHNTEKP